MKLLPLTLISSTTLLAVYWVATPLSHAPLPAPHYSTAVFNQQTAEPTISPLIDITLQAGIQRQHIQRSEQLSGLHESLGAGACAFDYDNDGWVDLLLLNGSGTTHFYGKPQWWQSDTNSISLYRNTQDGRFELVTQSSGLQSSSWSMGCAYGDIDNDGDQDAFLSHYGENHLWRNNGDGTFTNITTAANITGNSWSTSVNMVDVNRDGLLDIYVNNFIDFTTNSLTFEAASGYEASVPENFDASLYNAQANQLFINQGVNPETNDGNVSFIEQAKAFGVDNPQGRSLSALWVDMNNDQLMDVVIANANGSSNKVLLNQKGKRFTDITTTSRLGFVDKTSAISVSNINNDDQRELFFSTDHRLFPKLYAPAATKEHSTNTTYRDIANNYYLPNTTHIGQSHWGNVMQDVNVDGWLDIVIANGMSSPNKNAALIPRGQKNTLLINQKGKGFINKSERLAPNTESSAASRCVLSADFMNKGAPDFYFSNNNGLGQLLSNTTSQHRWLGIDIASTYTTPYGSKVSLTATGKWGTKTLHHYYGEQQGFLCHGDQRIVFGLGRFPEGSKLTIDIRWPDGKKYSLPITNNNFYYQIRRNSNGITSERLQAKQLIKTSQLSIQQAGNRLQIIHWLIAQKKVDLAHEELQLLIQNNREAIRLGAFIASQTLPLYYRDDFIQTAINDTAIPIKLQAIEAIKNVENESLNRWLLKQLEHQHTNIVCAAANTYGHFFDEEEAFLVYQYTALSPLIRLTSSNDNTKQQCAIEALGKSEHYRAVQPLIDQLNDDNPSVRLAAISALGLLKEKVAIEFLLARFNDNNEDNSVRGEALIAIKQIDPGFLLTSLLTPILTPISTPALEKSLADDTEPTVLGALYYAYHLSDNAIIIRNDLVPFTHLFNTQNIAKLTYPTEKEQAKTSIKINCEKSNLQPNYQHKSLSTCLSDTVFYKTQPELITIALEKNNEERVNALLAITSRKERWARELTLSALNDSSLSLAQKQQLLAHLPDKPPVGLQKSLMALLTTHADNDFGAYLTRYLLPRLSQPMMINGETLEKHTVDRLEKALSVNNEDRAMILADALFKIDPEKAILLLITPIDTITIQKEKKGEANE